MNSYNKFLMEIGKRAVSIRGVYYGRKGIQYKTKKGSYLLLGWNDIEWDGNGWKMDAATQKIASREKYIGLDPSKYINIGFYLNEGSDLLIIDIDNHGKGDGVEEFKQWAKKTWSLNGRSEQEALEWVDKMLKSSVKTPSGGYHIYFNKPKSIGNVRTKLNYVDYENREYIEYGNVDILSSGLVMGVGSMVFKDGEKSYYTGDDIKINDFPSFATLIKDRILETADKFISAKSRDYLELQSPEKKIPEGKRSKTLISLAGFLAGVCENVDDMVEILHHADKQYCSPPMSETDFRGMNALIRQAERYYNENKSVKRRKDFEKRGGKWLTLEDVKKQGYNFALITKNLFKKYSRVKNSNKKKTPKEIVDELIAQGLYDSKLKEIIGERDTPSIIMVQGELVYVSYQESNFTSKKTLINKLTRQRSWKGLEAKTGLDKDTLIYILNKEGLVFSATTQEYSPIHLGGRMVIENDFGFRELNLSYNDSAFISLFNQLEDSEAKALYEKALPSLRHIWHIAGGDIYLVKWLLSYIYYLVFTRERLPISVFYSRERGVGKSMFIYNILFPMLGNAVSKKSASMMGGRFNSDIAKSRLILLEELEGGKKELKSILKDLSTADTINVEEKFQEASVKKFFGSFVITTNEENFLDILGEEDRFAIFNVKPLKERKRGSEISEELRLSTPYLARLLKDYFTPIEEKGRFVLNTGGVNSRVGASFYVENLSSWKVDILDLIYEKAENRENEPFQVLEKDGTTYMILEEGGIFIPLKGLEIFYKNNIGNGINITNRSIRNFLRDYFPKANMNTRRSGVLINGMASRPRGILIPWEELKRHDYYNENKKEDNYREFINEEMKGLFGIIEAPTEPEPTNPEGTNKAEKEETKESNEVNGSNERKEKGKVNIDKATKKDTKNIDIGIDKDEGTCSSPPEKANKKEEKTQKITQKSKKEVDISDDLNDLSDISDDEVPF